jgi:molecular chaperone IbpA
MATSFLAPAHGSFLGFDRLFDQLESMISDTRHGQSFTVPTYPPTNLFREENGDYTIEMALAGYKKSQIKIELNRKGGLLTISGDTSKEDEDKNVILKTRETVQRKIATRKFSRSFSIADDLEVAEASLEDGLLVLSLKKIVREEDQPLLIPLK